MKENWFEDYSTVTKNLIRFISLPNTSNGLVFLEDYRIDESKIRSEFYEERRTHNTELIT